MTRVFMPHHRDSLPSVPTGRLVNNSYVSSGVNDISSASVRVLPFGRLLKRPELF